MLYSARALAADRSSQWACHALAFSCLGMLLEQRKPQNNHVLAHFRVQASETSNGRAMNQA